MSALSGKHLVTQKSEWKNLSLSDVKEVELLPHRYYLITDGFYNGHVSIDDFDKHINDLIEDNGNFSYNIGGCGLSVLIPRVKTVKSKIVSIKSLNSLVRLIKARQKFKVKGQSCHVVGTTFIKYINYNSENKIKSVCVGYNAFHVGQVFDSSDKNKQIWNESCIKRGEIIAIKSNNNVWKIQGINFDVENVQRWKAPSKL